ncbi:MFS transporter [Nocardia brasiliensis]|uniref:MFS transporter n=1 Tax=Nocardia brasiliensis TaxID=37326 RepID=UPI002457D097|nr:MFS transporter [Nocardia brasiliensis]
MNNAPAVASTRRSAAADWDRRDHLLLWAVSLTTFAIGIDTTVIGVALPSIHRELPPSGLAMSAIVVGYTLTFGALMLSAGHVADVFGRKRVFLCGAAAFAVASLICGVAWNVAVLVVARLIQGCAAAMLNSAGLALLAQTFAGARQRSAFRVWGAIMGASFAIGPLAGGAATEFVGWRWVFLVNVPVLLVCGSVVFRLVPSSPERRVGALDPFGQVLVIGLCASVFGAVAAVGASVPWTVLAAVTAALCLGILLGRKPAPGHILSRSYFSDVATVVITAVPVLFSLCFWCLLIIVPDRLGTGSAMTPMRAALMVLPLTIGLVLAALVPNLFGTSNFRLSFVVGFSGIGVGAAVAALFPGTAGLIIGMLIMGLAAGFMNPEVARSAITLAGPERAGMAGGLTSTMRQIGFGVGVLALGRLGTDDPAAGRALAPVFVTAGIIASLSAVGVLLMRNSGTEPRPAPCAE